MFREEVLQNITENAGNATNHSLTTVDKASKEDEATEATPDALD